MSSRQARFFIRSPLVFVLPARTNKMERMVFSAIILCASVTMGFACTCILENSADNFCRKDMSKCVWLRGEVWFYSFPGNDTVVCWVFFLVIVVDDDGDDDNDDLFHLVSLTAKCGMC